jgi:hypothetical protein
MKNLFLFLAVITLTFQTCSSSDDSDDGPMTAECATPLNLSVSEITEYSAVLNWNNPNTDLDVDVEYGPTGFSPGTGTVRSTSQNFITIDDLIPGTSYQFYVKSICAVDNTSTESALASFSTDISQFAGTWSGTYDGDDTGTWTFVVSVNSIVTESTAFSNNANATQQGEVGGTIPADGGVVGIAPNGTETTAQITGETLNGTWINPNVSNNFGGTLTGSRE